MAVSRVRVTTATKAYWPKTCQVLEFKTGEEVIGELADYLATSGVGVEVLDVVPEVEPEDPDGPGVDIDGDGVPEGSAKQVLAWVGDDPVRAAAALEAEAHREKPRTTLAGDLGRITGRADTPADTPAEPAP